MKNTRKSHENTATDSTQAIFENLHSDIGLVGGLYMLLSLLSLLNLLSWVLKIKFILKILKIFWNSTELSE